MNKQGYWNNIDNIEDYYITYLLYREGKTLNTIAKIRRLKLNEVEDHILKAKISLSTKKSDSDFLVELISLSKTERIHFLDNMKGDEKNNLIDEISKRYIHFKNPEDRMILIWLIGELKAEKLLPFLKMELLSNKVNYRRLSCSALGKIRNKGTKPWLEKALIDENPQVRQYAINALSKFGDEKTISLLEPIVLNDDKEYVKKSAENAIKKIKKL